MVVLFRVVCLLEYDYVMVCGMKGSDNSVFP